MDTQYSSSHRSGLSTSDQAAANQMPQYKVRTHVTWQELVEAMDLWFLSKTGRGFFDSHPHSSAYSRPKVDDYLTSHFFNEYSDQGEIWTDWSFINTVYTSMVYWY